MTTAWHHLPNAAHIDRILADLKLNFNNWSAVWHSLISRIDDFDAGFDVADDKIDEMGNTKEWDALWDAVYDVAERAYWYGAREAARHSIMSLIAWPESGDYLSLPVDQVRVMAELGDHRARLMLPAVMAFNMYRKDV